MHAAVGLSGRFRVFSGPRAGHNRHSGREGCHWGTGVSRDLGNETGKAHVPTCKGLVAEDARVRFLTGICRRLVASSGDMRSGVRTA
jgi:hypothetical protein